MKNKIMMKLAIFALALLLNASPVISQKNGEPDRGFKAGNSYAISDIESINLSGGGNVSLSIPLASLPMGRGTSPGFSISLLYDSKLWDSEQKWENDGVTLEGGLGGQDYARSLIKPAEGAGWRISTSYEFKVTNRTDAGNLEKCLESNSQNFSKNSYQWKISVDTPGGGSIPFRPRGYSDIHADGYFEIGPSGEIWQARYGETIEGVPNCPTTQLSTVTTGIDYYSTDGSSIRLFVPYDPSLVGRHQDGNRNWLMYFPDGTIVENKPPDDPSLRQRITDINGNRVRIKDDTYAGTAGVKILDDMNRFIFYGNGSVYQFGPNGEELKTTVAWKEIWVYRNYKTTDIIDPVVPQSKRYSEVVQSFNMVDEIRLPDQTGGGNLRYRFSYHADDTNNSGTGLQNYTDGWGELSSVELPSKAKAVYSYNLPQNGGGFVTTRDIVSNKVIRKDLHHKTRHDGIEMPETDTWLYNIDYARSFTTGPNGAVNTQDHYGKSPYDDDPGTDWRSGLVHTVTNPDGSTTTRVWKRQNDHELPRSSRINAYVSSEETTLVNVNGNPHLRSKREFEYDQNNNLLITREYDFVPVGVTFGPPVRKTVNTYYNPTLSMGGPATDDNHYSDPDSPALLKLLKSTEIQDGNGNPVSRSEFKYDDSLTPTKGMLTETRSWDSTKQPTLGGPDSDGFRLNSSNSISSSATYDSYGNRMTLTDANGISSHKTYGAVNGYPGLYPTETKTAFSKPEQRTSTAEYDFYTGLVTSTTDIENNVATEYEYDSLGRPRKTMVGAGTPIEVWTQTEYDDELRRVIIKADLETRGDGKLVEIRHFDELGRLRLSRSLENTATEDPYNEADGIKVQTRYKYDDGANPAGSDGLYLLTSNPYRASSSDAAGPEDTMGWTVSYSDKTGRFSTSETFSGEALPGPWGQNSISTGKTTARADSNTLLITDASGRQKRSIKNALGRLERIDEPDTNGNLGPAANPAQPTYYKYGPTGKLVEVSQGVQKRFFLYDSLGRMIRLRQPEQEINSALTLAVGEVSNSQWTAGFTHDGNGNVLTATNAENQVITAVYDNVNRVVSKTYSEGTTPAVSFTYDDPAIPYSKGRLTKVANSVSVTEITSFDELGRPKASKQTTDGIVYPMNHGYNLAGQLVEEKYPSGRIVKNELAANGDIARIYGRANATSAERTYATGFGYSADGRVRKLKIGNNRWENARFNSNLQVTALSLGASSGNGDLWTLTYEYGELNANETVDASKNTGNVAKQTLSFDDLASPLVQTYRYDSLQRITEARETNDGQQTWKQSFGFDRYGNRTAFSQDILGQQTGANNINSPAVDVLTNRFAAGQGYEYDKTGNLTKDVTYGQSRDIKFDGNNKQTEIRDASTGILIGEYFYDGNGKRVKKRVFGSDGQPVEDVIFVYSGDRIVAEYSTQSLPTNPTTKYVATDSLGSVRAITDQDGRVISRRDFLPFGEELGPDATYRKTDLKYGPDSVRQKFTGYQKDEESGLDFAEARMYNNANGRFTAVDPLLASGKSANPQTFNRYAYVMNNPLAFTDPDGMQAGRVIVPERIKILANQSTEVVVGDNTRGVAHLTPAIRALKMELADISYRQQASVANLSRANHLAGGEINPIWGEESNTSSNSAATSESMSRSGSVELSKAGGISGTMKSGSETVNASEEESTKTLSGDVTSVRPEVKDIMIETNLLIINYLNANETENGFMQFQVTLDDGTEVTGEFTRDDIENYLQDFVTSVRNQAECDFRSRSCPRQ